MIVLITYDLKRPGQDYSPVYDAIKETGDWAHPLESTWLVDTQHTTEQLRNHVRAKMDANDYLLVVRITGDWAAFLPTAMLTWLQSRTY